LIYETAGNRNESESNTWMDGQDLVNP